MKKIVAMLLAVVSLFTCVALTGCDSSSNSTENNGKESGIVYEEKFLGKWSNDEALFSFQYKDGVYSGGVVSNELSIVGFDKYTATKSTITLYLEDGRIETFTYRFSGEYLYLDDTKLERFN